MATPASPIVLTVRSRYADVSVVLLRVLALNALVAAAKIFYGYLSSSVAILSDGFHSLTDMASNVVALVGIRAAQRPPDANHPYGHRKFETLSSIGIFVFLAVVFLELLRTVAGRLAGSAPPRVSAGSYTVMLVTLAVNLVVVRYESRQARRLASELLMADARHTRSDVLTSLTVIAALIGVQIGVPLLDPIAGLIVAGFIARAGFEIARDASRILADEIVFAEGDVQAVVMSVPGVLGCHHIRSRGSADHAFLDLHVWMAPETPLIEAHRISHVVKDRLMARYPEIRDAVIHLEPPPPQAK